MSFTQNQETDTTHLGLPPLGATQVEEIQKSQKTSEESSPRPTQEDVLEYLNSVLRYTLRKFQGFQREELASECQMRVWSAYPRMKAKDWKGFVYRLVKFAIIDTVQRKPVFMDENTSYILPEDVERVADNTELPDEPSRLRRDLLEELCEQDQEIKAFVLRFVFDWSCKKIGEEYGFSHETARKITNKTKNEIVSLTPESDFRYQQLAFAMGLQPEVSFKLKDMSHFLKIMERMSFLLDYLRSVKAGFTDQALTYFERAFGGRLTKKRNHAFVKNRFVVQFVPKKTRWATGFSLGLKKAIEVNARYVVVCSQGFLFVWKTSEIITSKSRLKKATILQWATYRFPEEYLDVDGLFKKGEQELAREFHTMEKAMRLT